ncbi:hypothetical protein EW146_g6074 [Bondarzewia mesenterica]|uniref:FAD-binding PCMH-type domain-containing protein n=1 Tax=Bondarzewia mesenterica TaxID=1095465 RepID=A0A4S4LPN7_9AGAM|nr:hypothetical protein EW146_g6074 [Bondarzewia mesenterica]
MFITVLSALYALSLSGQASAATDESVALSTVTSRQWAQFNETVGGKLYTAIPFSAPCFSVVNGVNVTVDAAACQAVQAAYTSPSLRVENFGAYMLPQWETCQAKSQKCLLDGTNTSDPLAWGNVACQQGSISPYYVSSLSLRAFDLVLKSVGKVDVRSADDVKAVYGFAAKTGIPIAVKNSGHDYKGRSSIQGTLGLWVHNIDTLTHTPEFTPENCSSTYDVITAGAGVGFQTIYEFADSENITSLAGTIKLSLQAVCAKSQGGGHSILTPVYGLGVDRVVQFKVVTPDGKYRVANECQNQDLFWALRGGGGGTFGVVLETSSRVEPKFSLIAASIKFTQTSTNAAPWLKLVVNKTLQWGEEGWGGHIGAVNLINVTPLLNLTQAQDSLKEVSDYALSQNGTVVIEELPSWYAFFSKYVPAAQSAVGTENILGTRLIPTSLFETESGQEALYNALVNMLPTANPYIVVGTPYLYNGSSSSTSVTPAWYDSIWHLGFHETWQFNTNLSDIKSKYTSVFNITQTFRDITPGSGAYFTHSGVPTTTDYSPLNRNMTPYISLTAGNALALVGRATRCSHATPIYEAMRMPHQLNAASIMF